MQKIRLKKEPNTLAKYKAYAYQVEAFNALKDMNYGAIFHEQGLGKSKIALDIGLYWIKTKKIDTVLLVAKKGLVHNWVKEFEKHTFVKPKILSQNKKENYFVFNSPARFVIAHYEVIDAELERLNLYCQTRSVGMILDESTKIKNPYTKLSKAFFEISPLLSKKLILTGTPIANRPYDIWSQIFFLDQGKALGNNFIKFKADMDFTPELSDNTGRQEHFELSLAQVWPKIRPFSVRETKESGIITLPEKQYFEVKTDWEYYQQNMYEQVRKDLCLVLVKDNKLIEEKTDNILKRLLRLVQITSNPLLVDTAYNMTPGKFGFLNDILSNAIEKNEKCIVWSSFIGNVDWLAKKLKSYGSSKVHGKLSIADRNRQIDFFLNDPETKVLVATPSAAREGLTLTVANNVIFYDRGFSLDHYLQAQDRIHRISQEKECNVFNLIMKDSIDEWIDVLLNAKHLAARLAQRDISLEKYQTEINYDITEILRGMLGFDKKRNE